MNWYTCSLELYISSKDNLRAAKINKNWGEDGCYDLDILQKSDSLHFLLDTVCSLSFNTLAQAKAAGKAWVEQGIKPEEEKRIICACGRQMGYEDDMREYQCICGAHEAAPGNAYYKPKEAGHEL